MKLVFDLDLADGAMIPVVMEEVAKEIAGFGRSKVAEAKDPKVGYADQAERDVALAEGRRLVALAREIRWAITVGWTVR